MTNSNSIENKPSLKAYEMDDEYTIYAAINAEEALIEYHKDCDFDVDAPYPLELTNTELDKEHPDCDENEMPNGKTITVRQMLSEKKEAGYLCGGAY